jgi:hypothetical protein
VADSYEHDIEPLGSIKCGELLDYLSDNSFSIGTLFHVVSYHYAVTDIKSFSPLPRLRLTLWKSYSTIKAN